MPQGAGFSGDRGGQIKRGPRRSLRRGKEPCSSRKPSSFWTKDERRKTEVGRQRCGGRSALFPQQRPRSGAGPVICPAGGAGKRSCQRRSRRIGRTGSRSRRRFGAFLWSAGPTRPKGPKGPGASPFPCAQSRPASWNTPQAQSQARMHCSRETPAAFQPEASSRRTAAMAAMQGV